MATIVVIVTGSIAAPNSIGLISGLKATRQNEIAVVMTRAARRFVGPEVLRFTGGADAIFTDETSHDGEFPNHIALAKHATKVIAYPASAHFIGRVANGIASDLAANVALCSGSAKRIIFPSVNGEMWSSTIFQRNLEYLRAAGFYIYPTTNGMAPLPDVAMEYLTNID